MSLLSKAIRGGATAGAAIMQDQLSELRQQRYMEAQQAYQDKVRNEENARQDQIRAEANSHRDAREAVEDQHWKDNKDMQNQQFNATKDLQQKQLGISQENLDLSKDNAEFSKVSGAYKEAMSGVDDAEKRLQAAIAMKPQIDPTTGQPINDPDFGPKRAQLIDSAQADLQKARVYAVQAYKELGQRFPQNRDYFLPPQSSSGNLSAAPSASSDDSIPPLLKRPQGTF